MASIRLKFVDSYRDRHGKQRFYFRRKGQPRTPLPGQPGSRQFMAAYQAALAMEPAPLPVGVERSKAGTFSALIAAYYTTTGWKTLKPITQNTYRNILERFRVQYGELRVEGVQRKHIAAMLDALADKPGAQQGLRRVLSVLMKLAIEREWIDANPMTGIRRERSKSTGIRSWTEADIAAFEAKHPSGSKERLALALLLYTAQRRQDVVTMGRQHLSGATLRYETSKSNGRTKLAIPIHPNLQRELDQVPATQLTFLLTSKGGPFTPSTFSSWFDRAVKQAGITDQASAHGLRKAACRRLAEAGCTPSEIMAISGHKNLSEVTLYTEAANQQALAKGAIKKIGTGTPSA